MSAYLAPIPISDLYTWRSGVESLSPAKSPCPGLYGEQWQKTHANMLDFLEQSKPGSEPEGLRKAENMV